MQVWKKLKNAYTSYWQHQRPDGRRRNNKMVRAVARQEIEDELDSIREFQEDKQLTNEYTLALEEAETMPTVNVKSRELPSRNEFFPKHTDHFGPPASG